ncbi:hypothetical protein AAC387_Pa01g2196 [Persea americana]
MKEKEGPECLKRAEVFAENEPRQQLSLLELAYGRSNGPSYVRRRSGQKFYPLERASFWEAPLEQMFPWSSEHGLCPRVASCTLFAPVWTCGTPEDSWMLGKGNVEYKTHSIMENKREEEECSIIKLLGNYY